jgi:hypothetical protein
VSVAGWKWTAACFFICLASQPLFPFWAWKLGSEVQGRQGTVGNV